MTSFSLINSKYFDKGNLTKYGYFIINDIYLYDGLYLKKNVPANTQNIQIRTAKTELCLFEK